MEVDLERKISWLGYQDGEARCERRPEEKNT